MAYRTPGSCATTGGRLPSGRPVVGTMTTPRSEAACRAARVRGVLRRSQARQEEEAICFEGLCLDLQSKVCRVNGQEVPLTKKEFEILTLLLSHPRVIFSREQIIARVWNNEVIVLDRTIDVNITRLRKKIGPYGSHLVTRLGYGYGFEK